VVAGLRRARTTARWSRHGCAPCAARRIVGFVADIPIPAGAEARRYVARREVPWPGPVLAYVLEPGGTERPLVHVVRHSPDGFDYGYGGSAPADLARSILVDFFDLGDAPDLLPVSYQRFKWQLVAGADGSADSLEISGTTITAWVRRERSAVGDRRVVHDAGG
jgi:hypothetical protein